MKPLLLSLLLLSCHPSSREPVPDLTETLAELDRAALVLSRAAATEAYARSIREIHHSGPMVALARVPAPRGEQ